MSALPIYEVLGDFYLGRQYDPKQKKTTSDLILFPSKNLVTHGLVVGMTGSGKTGLCLDIIEEAAIDNIPVIAIDPKGDLGNLLLTFPGLKPEEFKPWVNEEEAKKAGISIDDYAAKQAEFWKNGLAKWDQDGERIVRLREAADFAIYTPGSSAGWPVSVMRSFEKPTAEVMEDGELFRERVLSTAASLLQLIGIEADAVQSRETVLLTNLIQNTWSQGKNFDLAGLIQEVQQPSISKIGVLDVDSFYPAKQRFELAMKLNNLLASPSFAGWMQGEPLDIQRMLYTPEGKPRVCVFSIAHLSDPERMFFVTMLLNQMLAWMRSQKGTSSLRAMLYMDEIFGYFPPIANPPSKMPLLTMLKQARAFGLGVVLATQNPVDLDYKGLANIGTWFIGRLQTDRDKARILDGLEGAASDQGGKFNRAALEQTLAGLGSRIFLLHSVHTNEQKLFESRWAMSYLSGPLSRTQIKQLMAGKKGPSTGAETKTPVVPASSSKSRPVLPPEVKQLFVPSRRVLAAGERLVYQPRLLGASSIRYTLARAKLDYPQDVTVTVEVRDGAVPVDWSESEEVDIAIGDLTTEPEAAEFQEVSAALSQPKNMAKWEQDFENWLYTKRFQLKYCEYYDLYSTPNETDADFNRRLDQKFREDRDLETDKVRRRYESKIAAAEERIRKEKARVDKKNEQAAQGKFTAFLSFIASLIAPLMKLLTGKHRGSVISATDISKTATSARGAGRAMQQSADVGRAEEDLAAAEAKLEDLKKERDEECRVKVEEIEQASKKLEVVEGKSTRANINVKLVALAWLPYYANDTQTIGKAY